MRPKALDQAIALNPRRVEAYVLRSAVYAARKQYKQGIELMRRAQALAPADEEVLTALGSQLVLSGDAAAGVPLLQQVTRQQRASRYDAQLLLGHHWHATGKWPDAIAALEAYFTHRPAALAKEDARHRVDLADAYLRYRQPAKALALFKQAAAAAADRLRARIGVAWATAAVDCRQGAPAAPRARADRRAAPRGVARRRAVRARARRRRRRRSRSAAGISTRAPQGSAAGHALVGEAQAARGNLGEARTRARDRAPARVRRGGGGPCGSRSCCAAAGEPKSALAALEKLGPPATPGIDPDWWTELGEALIASGDPQAAPRPGSAPVLPELPGDATVRTVTGAAQLASGAGRGRDRDARRGRGDRQRAALAASCWSRRWSRSRSASWPRATPRPPSRCSRAPISSRARRSCGATSASRGSRSTSLGRAVPVLDRAAKAEPTGLTLMLAARAHALAGDLAGARPLYERALAVEKDNAVEVALDWAASEVAGGDPTLAVAALEKTAAAAKGTALAARHKSALATRAPRRRGRGAARGQRGAAPSSCCAPRSRASRRWRRSAISRSRPSSPATRGAALTALRAVSGQSCPFPPPADTQAAPILIAFTEGRTAKRAGKALDRLTALDRQVERPGGGAARHRDPRGRARGRAGCVPRRPARAGAQVPDHRAQASARGSGPTSSRTTSPCSISPRASSTPRSPRSSESRRKVPEALVNLGIAYERKGDPVKALDAWRRARKAGVRFGPLADWIESKERIYGGGP